MPITPSLLSYNGISAILLSVVACAIGGQAMLAAADIENGALYETLNSPAPRISYILGRTIAAIPRSILGLVFVIPFITLTLGLPSTGEPLLLVGVVILTILGTAPIGEIIGNGVGNREQALLLSVIITILGYFAGGGLAPVSLLPQPYRSITLLSPMTYALDFWIRSFFIGSQGILLFPIFMLFFWWILLTALGAVLLSRRSIK
ncbi:MAG: ABC transporter permease [Candidatus Thorarchaeota archaeon]